MRCASSAAVIPASGASERARERIFFRNDILPREIGSGGLAPQGGVQLQTIRFPGKIAAHQRIEQQLAPPFHTGGHIDEEAPEMGQGLLTCAGFTGQQQQEIGQPRIKGGDKIPFRIQQIEKELRLCGKGIEKGVAIPGAARHGGQRIQGDDALQRLRVRQTPPQHAHDFGPLGQPGDKETGLKPRGGLPAFQQCHKDTRHGGIAGVLRLSRRRRARQQQRDETEDRQQTFYISPPRADGRRHSGTAKRNDGRARHDKLPEKRPKAKRSTLPARQAAAASFQAGRHRERR